MFGDDSPDKEKIEKIGKLYKEATVSKEKRAELARLLASCNNATIKKAEQWLGVSFQLNWKGNDVRWKLTYKGGWGQFKNFTKAKHTSKFYAKKEGKAKEQGKHELAKAFAFFKKGAQNSEREQKKDHQREVKQRQVERREARIQDSIKSLTRIHDNLKTKFYRYGLKVPKYTWIPKPSGNWKRPISRMKAYQRSIEKLDKLFATKIKKGKK